MKKILPVGQFKRSYFFWSVLTAFSIILLTCLSVSQVKGQNCTVNAGVDQTICGNTAMTLSGVANGLFQGSGNITWTQVLGPSVTIVNPHSLITNATGFSMNSTYSFVLSAKCLDGSLVQDLVSYTVKPITFANAGPDQTLCPGSGFLAANAPAGSETGLWTVVSGSGVSITTPSSPTSAFTLSQNGSTTVTLRWTITGPAGIPQCFSEDDLIITNPGGIMPVTAGPNQVLSNCYSSTTSTSLAGSYGGNGTNGQQGIWTVISGPNIPTFGNANQSNTSVSNLIQGIYTLQWTVSGPCVNGSATMTITVPAPTANVTGASASSLSFCDGRTSFVLTGNDPLYAGETVHWAQTSGPAATIVSPNTPITSVTVPSGTGSYSFSYTISNLSTGCSSSATANVTFNIPPSLTLSAGSFITLPCSDSTATVNYSETGSGTVQWSIISGPANWFYPVIPTGYQNASASPQLILHLSKPGTYVIRFRKTPGVGSSCSTVYADISIITSVLPSLSNAGTSQLLACNIFNTALAGNVPTIGIGRWSQVSGPNTAVLSDPNLNTSNISGLINGVYVMRWLISAGPSCPSSQSETRVVVASIVPTAANAGPDQLVCFATPLTLQGNNPILNEVGTWTVVPSAGITFSDIHAPHAIVNGLLVSTVYTFTWTITNACGTTSDNAVITTSSSAGPVPSNAGPDQCLPSGTTTMTLAGNVPAPGTGLWTRLTGPNLPTITTPSLYNSTVTGMVNGTYTFEWTITLGTCSVSRDTMMVTISASATIANAGGNQHICGNSVTLTGNTPVVGTGRWTQEVGNAGVTIVSPASATTLVTGLTAGVYVFRWTISNQACPGNYAETTIYVSTPPSPSIAGSNQTLCGVTSTNMAATPVITGTGTWLMVSGPNTPVIANYNSPTTLVSGLITGAYIFRWTVSNGPNCPVNTSDVTITVYENANAGLDQTYCDATTVNLSGNVASTGAWTQVGTTPNVATITTTGSNTATASGLITGVYTFQYTITGAGGCPGSFATMHVTISGQPAPAFAGPDQDLCGVISFTFVATPDPVPGGQTGTWTQIFGPGGGSFSDLHSPTAIFNGAVPGLYVFVWTISEGGCSNGDQVRIINSAPPTTSDAGPTQAVCGTVVTMAANTPVNGTGNWTQVSGPNTASITSVILPNTTITGLIDGTYVFRWTISNPPCPSSSSDVTINDHTAPTTANAGPDQSLCNVLAATLAGNVITTGSGLWTQTGGPAATITTPSSNSSTVIGLTAPGVYQFTWTSTLAWTYGIGACTTSDIVQITNNPLPSVSNAGPDQSICLYSPITLAANTPAVGIGTWTQTAGPTTVSFADAHSPTTIVNGVDQGFYTFRWTIANDGCPSSIDDVNVSMNPNPTIAVAGPNQIKCNNTTATMAANTPDPGHGTGTWTQISGPVTATITSLNSPTTTITGITTAGVYVFQWEIATAPLCVSADQLQITKYSDVVITGPSDATICNGGTQLLTVSASGGTGPYTYQWQQSNDGSTGWGNVVGGAGATTASYTTAALASDLYYRCIVTCDCGTATSSVAHVTVVPDPNISVNPVGSTICSGATWTMSVTASGGTPSLNYQWQYSTTGCSGWNNIGGNSPNYTTAALTQTTYYHVLVSATGNGCITATSACATVFVPVITTQPAALTNICNGGSITLTTAAAGGTATFTYQWESSATGVAPWTPIPGETTSSYTTPVLPTGEYYYHCVIGVHTPACADLITTVAHVHVVKDPIIDIQPTSPADICAGGTTADMVVTASGGTPSLTYQWEYFNGATWNNVVNLTPAGAVYTGGTLNTFHVAGISVAGSYLYRSLVSAAGLNCDQATSNTVTVTVIPDPSLSDPVFSNTAICVGGSTIVSSAISGGTGVPTYQWQYWNGAAWNNVVNNTPAGATYTNATMFMMNISGTTATGSFQYRLTTNNASGCNFNSAGVSYTVIADPAITVQPAGSNICVGGFATMSVTATGGTPLLLYQWQSALALAGPYTDVVGGVGGNTASYTSPVLATTTYYHVVVSAAGDGCGTVTSNNITVTVLADPIINSQPLGNIICNGGTHTMTVSASGGTPTLHYQWQYSLSNSPYSWVNIGGDLNTYTTVALSATTYYQVIVTAAGSDCNTTISNAVTVTVVPDPTIDAQPTDATICSGTTTTLTVSASGGTPSLIYQWQYSLSNSPYAWINIGGNSNTYTTAALTSTTYYHVLISATGNGCDPVVSNPLAVHIPHITTQPVSATVCDGGTQLLSVAAGSDGGTATYAYQWQVSAIDCSIGFFDIPGANGTTYTTPALTGNRFYQCVISVLTPTCTLITNCASVTVVPDPFITGQPTGGTICSGSTFTMSVTAGGGTPSLNYQWQYSLSNSPYSWINVGGNSSSYTTAALAATTYYQVIVSATGNGCGTATSVPVTVTVSLKATASAGSNAATCSTSSYTLAGASAANYTGLLWTTSGTGTFNNPTALNPIYTPSAADITAGSVVLTLTATSSAPCTNTSSSMTLSITKAPVANAGSNATICSSAANYTLSGATASNYLTLAWTTSGTGSFSSTTILNPVYTPSAADKTAGIVTLTLTANPLAGCGSAAISAMTLTIVAAPTANAGGNNTICSTGTYSIAGSSATNYSSLLWTTSGTGIFNNPTSINPIYTPSAADITAGTVTLTLTAYANAPCSNASSSMTLSITKAPVANAGLNGSTCQGTAYTVSGASASNYLTILWTAPGPGLLTNAATLTPTYTPTAGQTGTVILTLTANPLAGCGSAAVSTMTLTITAAATANAGGNNTICSTGTYSIAGSSATNYSSLLWTTSGTGIFNNPTSVNPIYTPSAADITAGTVTLTLTAYANAPCSNASSSMTLSITKAPVANAGLNGSTCQGTAYTVSGASASNYLTILWTAPGPGLLTNAATLTPTYTPTAGQTGTVILTLTANPLAGCGSAAVSTMTLTITAAATANAGGNNTICSTGTYSIAGSSAANYSSLLWTTSGTGIFNNPTSINPIYTPSAADITAGTVNLTLTANANAPCTSASNTMTLTINAAPLSNAGPNQTFCSNITSATMAANTPVAPATGFWTQISGPGSPVITTPASPITTITSLGIGVSVFRWTVSNGVCTPAASDVTITRKSCGPVTYNEHIYTCLNSTASGNILANGDYSPEGRPLSVNTTPVSDVSHGTFSVLANGDFTYTPTNGYLGTDRAIVSVCDNVAVCTNDTVFINVVEAVTADAGPNQQLCEQYTTFLTGNMPPAGSVGNWTFVSGPNAVTPSPSNTPMATVIGLIPSTTPYVFRYTITTTFPGGTTCTSFAEVQVINYHYPSLPYAGPDQQLCLSGGPSTSTTMNGNIPTYGAGTWIQDSGPSVAVIANISDPATIVSGLIPGTYAFLWRIGNGICDPNQDKMFITVNTPATAVAGPDAAICGATSYTLSGSSASNYTSLMWATSGTGYFNDPTILHPVYTASAGDVTSGSVVLTLTAYSTVPCSNAVSPMTLSITAGPVANAGPNATVCQGTAFTVSGATASNYASLLWTAPGPGVLTNATTLTPTYTPTAGQTGTVILTLTASPNPGCSTPAVSTMTLTINSSATASAGSNASICEGSVYTLSGSSATNYSSLLWTTSGTGYFNDPNLLHPVYTASAADIAAGSVTLTLTANGNPPCGNATGSMTLSISRQPIASAGANATICETTTFTLAGSSAQYYTTLSWTTSGTGAFNDATILHPVYTPSAADITAGSVTLTLHANANAPCANVTSSMTLSISRQPIASAGPNATICETTTYTLGGSSAQYYATLTWTTSGTGTFSNAATLHPIYTPSAADIAAGSVLLTLNLTANAPCINVNSSMTLSITRSPLANAGPNATVCQGTAYTVSGATASNYASLLWTAPGPGVLTNATTLTPMYTPTAGQTGTVILTLTASPNPGCPNPAVSTMTLTINASATSSAGANASICEGSVYTLSGSTATNYSSLLWTTSGTGYFNDPNLLHPVYTASAADIAAGSVTLTLTANGNLPCGNATSSMTLSISRQPVASAGPNATICETTTYTLAGSSAQYYTTLNWTTSGTGTFSNATILHPVYTPSAADITAGGVTLTLHANANAPCANVTSSMTLSISRQPIASAGPNATICETTTYTLGGSSAQYYATLNWTTSGTGTFSNPADLHPIYTPSAADIATGSVLLTLNLTANAPCINVNSSMTLSITRAPLANAGPNATVCQGTAYTVSGATASNYASILWIAPGPGILTNASTLTPTYTPTAGQTGTVILTLLASPNLGCSIPAISTMTLTINASATSSAGANASICEGSVYTLSGSTASNYSSLLWTTSGTGYFNDPNLLHPVYTASAADIAAGSVTLTLTANGNPPCGNAVSSMTLGISRQPVASAGPNAAICETTTYTLSGSSAQYYTTLSWTTSGTGTFNDATILHPVYTPSAADITAGSVILTLHANANVPCSNTSSSMTLSISRQPVASAGPNITICETTTYTLSGSSSQYYSSLNWTTSGTGTFNNPATLHPIYTPSAADIAAGSVVLTLQANANAPCNNVTSSMTLSITRQAIAYAGPNATICETTTYILSGSSAQYYTTLSWTTSGTGTFNDATILHPIYTPSAADITAGSVTLTLHANANVPCSNTSSSMTLSISRQPVASAGPNATICETTTQTLSGSSAQYYSSLNWTTSGTGTFSNATVLHPVYTPSAADIAAGSVVLTLQANANAPCNNVTSSMTLSITRQAIAYAGPNATICETTTYTLSGSSAQYYTTLSWTTSGTGTFNDATILHPVYTPSAADITAGSVILSLHANANVPCSNTSSSMTLSISRQAVVNAGQNATICEGSTYMLNGSTAQYAATINWTTSGTGTFSNPAALHPIYTPGMADVLAGSVTLTITVTSNPPCANASSFMILNINRAPIAYAGPNSSTCQGIPFTVTLATAQFYSSILWTVPGPGILTNATTLNPVYTPVPSQIGPVVLTLTVTGNAPCGSATSQMTLNVVPAAIADAGPDATICGGSAFTVQGSSASNYSSLLWTTSGSGIFVDPAILHPIYNPGAADIAAGSVILTLHVNGNTPCSNITDAMTLTIVRAPVANAGPDGSTCQGQAFTVSGATAQNYSTLLWTHNGTGTLTGAATLNPTYTPAAYETGPVTLTLSVTGNQPCGTVTDQMTLDIIPAPVANAGPDVTICQNSAYTISGATAVNYSAIIWISNGLGTLTNATTLTPTYFPATNEFGTVTLTLTADGYAPCGVAMDIMLLQITPKATADAGPDISSCGTAPVTLAAAAATNYFSLEWSTSGSGIFNNPAFINPVYSPSPADILNGHVVLTLTAIAGNPCTAVSDNMTLTISKEAVANAGPDESTCQGASFMITGASAQNYSTLLWTHNGMGTLTGANTITPTYNPAAGETGQVILTLTVTPVAPCQAVSDQMVLSISTTATANAGPDAASCGPAPFTLSGASATNYSALTWTTSGTGNFNDPHVINPVYTPSLVDILTGHVVLTLTIDPIIPCAVETAHMTLTLTGTPVANAGPNGSTCAGVTFTVTGATAVNYSSILWTTNGTGVLSGQTTLSPTYTPAPGESGSVTLTLTIHGTGGCASATATSQMNIVIGQVITANAGNDQTIPRNSSTTLLGLASGGSGVYAFSWQPATLLIGASTDHPETVKLGDNVTFYLTVTDLMTGCQNTDSVKIIMNQGIEAITAVNDHDTTGVNIPIFADVLSNDSYSKNLRVSVTLCSAPQHGLASVFSDNMIRYTPNQDFHGIDSMCYILCYDQYPEVCDTAEVYIFISSDSPINWLDIHNVITPNGDGVNDGWVIDGIEEFPDNTIQLFNRWGDKVNAFERYNNTTQIWKGDNFKHEPLPDGTYYYIVTIKDGGTRTGWVLIRGSSR